MGGCTAIHADASGCPVTCSGRRASGTLMWRPRTWTGSSFDTASGTKGVYMSADAEEETQINFSQYKAWMQVRHSPL